MLVSNIIPLTIFFILVSTHYSTACIKLLNREWKKVSLEERTNNANLVVTAKILYTESIPGQHIFYSATFKVINVLKGWDLLQQLFKMNSTSVTTLEPHIIATAIGFGDGKYCFSSVEEGESYALFLGYKEDKDTLVTRYDDLFGAADRLIQRTERDILATLGWEEWSAWSECTVGCGSGTQLRKRGCRKSTKIPECHGPSVQKRQCNTFHCKDSFDILKFILNQRKDHISSWQPYKDDDVFKNSINQPSPAKAPTHLLLAPFPSESVLHISFKGPVKDTQFLHSIYDANNRLEFGVKVSRYSFTFTYDKKIDPATKFRRTVPYTYNFSEDMWYSIAIHLKNKQVSFKINCGEILSAAIDTNLTSGLDIYGKMYLGAPFEFENEKSHVRVEIGSIIISKDPSSFTKQCGKLLNNERSAETAGETEGSGMSAGQDDSESGDVDEEYGSGEGAKAQECHCLNGGICKANSTCFCARGWSGARCEIPICKNKCLNGGVCTAPNKCSCKRSTSGSYCQFNECQLPCQNNGECIGSNKCRCKKGFEGPQCQYESCSQRCMNGGTCQPNGKCVCAAGYKGEKCQYPENCKEYITKLVKYVKPATEIKFYHEEIPCNHKLKKCLIRRSKSVNVETTDYRQVYVCKS